MPIFIKRVLAGDIATDQELQETIGGFEIEGLYAAFDALSQWVLVFGVVLAVIAFGVSGITFLFSRGDAQKLSQAKKTAVYATVGTVLILIARTIVVLIGRFFS